VSCDLLQGKRLSFLCYPDTNHTIGGVKQIYRQVELLHQAGCQAQVIQEQRGFRPDWFGSDTPVQCLEDFLASGISADRDLIVMPETWLTNVPRYLPGVPKVIFNQNAYYTFGLDGRVDPCTIGLYRHPDIAAVVTVSRDNADLLVEACGVDPSRCFTVINGIDSQVFFPPPVKVRRIAFLARKHVHHARTLQCMAEVRPTLAAYRFHEIPRCSHDQLAAELRDSLVFLSCGHPEGFGLPLAEAIACACIPVGYHGMGGRDFCHPALYSVEYGDLLGFLQQLEAAVLRFEQDPQTVTQELLQRSEQLLHAYSLEAEEQRCLQVWAAIASGVHDKLR